MKNTGGNNIPSRKLTILGVGNELLSDEGIGVHVIKKLQKIKLPPEVEVIEGGTDGFGLINIITEIGDQCYWCAVKIMRCFVSRTIFSTGIIPHCWPKGPHEPIRPTSMCNFLSRRNASHAFLRES